jgi:hypothetical protein
MVAALAEEEKLQQTKRAATAKIDFRDTLRMGIKGSSTSI